MQASRMLRSAAEKHGGFLLPRRTTMDVLASAANAVLNLFSSEIQRKRFTAAVNSGVIAPEVLGQANLSFFRILALHDELDSPTLKEYGFEANEFLEGVKPALEQVHQVQAQLENELRKIASSSSDDNDNDDGDDDEMDPLSQHPLSAILLNNPDTSNAVKRMFKKQNSFQQVAEKDPESNEARLVAMFSPQHFQAFELTSKIGLASSPPFHDHSVQVHNVALLSARGMVITPEDDDKAANDEITTEEAQQKVVDSGDDDTKKPPAVAAQVEVLYDFEETLEVMAEEGDLEADHHKSEDKKDEAETKTITRTSVAVGIFEGWLSGGDNPEEGLRWKLAQIRYPLEFPFLNVRGSIE